MGLSVQQNKCKVLLPKSKSASKVIHGKGFCFAGRVMPLLGTVVGRNPDGITRWLRKKVDQWKEVLLLLERKEMPAQLSVLLARWIMIAKPNSLLRSIFPDNTAKELDEAVIRCLEKRLSLPLVDIPRQVLQLRIKDGVSVPRLRRHRMRTSQVWQRPSQGCLVEAI